jgi:hypothetical protein
MPVRCRTAYRRIDGSFGRDDFVYDHQTDNDSCPSQADRARPPPANPNSDFFSTSGAELPFR